jgi:hypothetical protein
MRGCRRMALRVGILRPEKAARCVRRILYLPVVFLAIGFGEATKGQAQEPAAAPGTEAIVDAARNARQQRASSTNPPKVVTNDDFSSGASSSPSVEENVASRQAAAAKTDNEGCKNAAEEERIKAELQEAQDELDELRRETSYNPLVISDNDVDLSHFQPGKSGLDFGSPPLIETQPQSPARVSEAMLEGRIARLKAALKIVCQPPKVAGIQSKLDAAEQELKLAQQQFALDQNAFYSKPNYSEDTAGKAKLDAEQEQIAALESEVDRLNSALPAPTNTENAL